MQQKVIARLNDMEDEIIASIQESIRIKSVRGQVSQGAPYGKGPKEALNQALALGEKYGLKTKNVDNRAGWVEYGHGKEMIAVLGHLDVVPAGDGWAYPPFAAEIHAGKLYGRGVLDDKGPVIGAICALKAFKDLGIKLERRIRVIFGCDEESGCSGIKHYIAAGEELPIWGFTPDGDYPLIFFEKGMTTIVAGKKDPQQGQVRVLSLQGGKAKNIVTDACRLVIEGTHDLAEGEGLSVLYENGNTIVESVGIGAHGSKPELGINAAIRLLKAVKQINFGGDFQLFMNFIVDEIGLETTGKKLGIFYHDEETGTTTVNLGIVSYSQEEMSLTLDIRYPKNGLAEDVYKNMDRVLKQYGMEMTECKVIDSLYVSKECELVQKLMRVYHQQTGRNEQAMAIGGGTYAKMFKNMVAFGPVFPGEPDVIHQANEAVSIEKLMESIKITGLAALDLATTS